MDFGDYLEERISEGLELLRKRNPSLDWSREQLVRLAVGYGLNILFREHERVKVSYRGAIRRLYPAGGSEHPVTVIDLSQSGVGMVLDTGASEFRKNEILLLDFATEAGLCFVKPILVRTVHRKRIGGIFADPAGNRDIEALLRSTRRKEEN